MSPSFIHSSNPNLAIAAVGGTNYWLQAIWATDPGLLLEPPSQPRTAANYLEAPELWVGAAAPTAAAPAIIRAEPAWWHRARESERTLWCRVSWRAKPADAWIFKASVEFVVNHAPDAVTLPEQVVELDPTGAIVTDVRLDGTASSDVDRTAATNPAGPLGFSWAAVATPPAMAAGGPVALSAAGLAATADPLFLSAGTVSHRRGSRALWCPADRRRQGARHDRRPRGTVAHGHRGHARVPRRPGRRGALDRRADDRQAALRQLRGWGGRLIAYRVDPGARGPGARTRTAGGSSARSRRRSNPPVAFSRHGWHQGVRDDRRPAPGGWSHPLGRPRSGCGRAPSVGAFDLRLELLDAAGASTGVAGAGRRRTLRRARLRALAVAGRLRIEPGRVRGRLHGERARGLPGRRPPRRHRPDAQLEPPDLRAARSRRSTRSSAAPRTRSGSITPARTGRSTCTATTAAPRQPRPRPPGRAARADGGRRHSRRDPSALRAPHSGRTGAGGPQPAGDVGLWDASDRSSRRSTSVRRAPPARRPAW